MSRLIARLVGVSEWRVFVTACATVLLTAAGAWALGGDVVFSPVYAAAVAVTAWACRVRLAFVVAALAASATLAIDLVHREALPTVAAGANALFRFAWMAAFGYGSALLRILILELADRASRDDLTGLLNGRGFREVAEVDRQRALRSGRPMSLVYFDVDGLKGVNDGFGHDAGDRLLADFAAALDGVCRTGDWPARIGGDEFVLLLPETDAPGTMVVIERLKASGAPAASAGSVTWTDGPPDLEAMLVAADVVMYEAKQAGSGAVFKMAGGQEGEEVRVLP